MQPANIVWKHHYLKAGVICCIDGKMTCMNDQLCNWYIFVILLI